MDPFFRSACQGDLETLRGLVRAGWDVSRIDRENEAGPYNALFYAILYGHLNVQMFLLRAGVNPNHDVHGTTVVHMAASYGSPALLRVLHDCGGDLEAGDGESRTPLHCAAEVDSPATVHYLLKKSVDLNAKDHKGMTPLMTAVNLGNEGIVEILLRAGADVAAKDNHGNDATEFPRLHFTSPLVHRRILVLLKTAPRCFGCPCLYCGSKYGSEYGDVA